MAEYKDTAGSQERLMRQKPDSPLKKCIVRHYLQWQSGYSPIHFSAFYVQLFNVPQPCCGDTADIHRS